MTPREQAMAILHDEHWDTMPIVHFGFWEETLATWADEGHISREDAETWSDCSEADIRISKALGFSFNWSRLVYPDHRLRPAFTRHILEEDADGNMKVLNEEGVIVMEKRNVVSIPTEIDHYFNGRTEWESDFRHRLLPDPSRYTGALVPAGNRTLPLNAGGLDYLTTAENREYPVGLYAGSLIGFIRDFAGIINLSYLTIDDPGLLEEMVRHIADLSYTITADLLASGARFDYLHFWEDICFKNGPLINPRFFRDVIGPHYRRITELAASYDIDIISVDCDGWIDHLVPIWLENGVNTMFPIEVGTWHASIAPWREQYGNSLRGVGGMNKTVFSRDRKAVRDEVERLKPLVDLGGYIPCPDHRIPPDAEWDNVRCYCDLMQNTFG